jgi:hypothetical protein
VKSNFKNIHERSKSQLVTTEQAGIFKGSLGLQISKSNNSNKSMNSTFNSQKEDEFSPETTF